MINQRLFEYRLGLLVLTMLAVIMPQAVSADDSIGKVVVSRGTVTAVTGSGERALKQGDDFYIHEQIMTAEKSFAVLQFVDGAKVTVRPESELVVEEYAYNSGEENSAMLNLVSGGLRIVTGAVAKANPENYKVKTPMALMGVRGTEFVVQLCGEELCDEYQVEEPE